MLLLLTGGIRVGKTRWLQQMYFFELGQTKMPLKGFPSLVKISR